MNYRVIGTWIFILCLLIFFDTSAQGQKELDMRVEKFLKEHKGDWHDLNVPYEDGKVLHDLIVSMGEVFQSDFYV